MPQTEVITVNPEYVSDEHLQDAGKLLREGGLVAFPTETVYGLGANALDPVAVDRIFEAKGRPANNPLIVHVSSVAHAKELTSSWPDIADLLADRFWPGPLTLVLPKNGRVSDVVTAGGPTIAIRIPSHPVARAMLSVAAIPIAAPSANRSNKISPTTAAHVLKTLDGRIDLLIDGGATPGGIESTVLDLTSHPPRILRPGIISRRLLQQVIGDVDVLSHATAEDAVHASPGMMSRHYSPRAGLELLEPHDALERVLALTRAGMSIGWLDLQSEEDETLRSVIPTLYIELPRDPLAYATHLFGAMHRLDDAGVDHIVVTTLPDDDAWAGSLDRLRRAVH